MFKFNLKSLLAVAIVATATMSACGDDEAPSPSGNITFTLTPNKIEAPTTGGTYEISVSTNATEWKAFSQEEWMNVTVTGNTTSKGTITVKVAENKGAQRTGEIKVQNTRTQTQATIPVTQQAAEQTPDDDIKCPISGYKLVWNDEFDGSKVDAAKWTFATGAGGWGNGEIQNYSSSTKAAEVSNGTLKIHLFKEGSNVYSARMYGARNTGFCYGYIEARLKLPTGKGTWPAFWMMPVKTDKGWPHDGEIDIMEEVGYDPDMVYSTLHCTKYNNTGTSTEGKGKRVSGSQTGFHTYGMEWTADKMDFYIDGTKFFTYRNEGTQAAWPFNTNFYPILNLAWGGGWGGAKGIDESCLPAVYEIDYVRVFQK